MKSVYIVFNDREKSIVSRTLLENLQYVFEQHIEVKICFLNELDETTKLNIADGDIFLVLYRERVYGMRDYITNLDKVIVLSRTLQKKYLPDISSIPEGTNVLLVNDSYESTLQTANTLYELGINHINLIPFEEGVDYDKYYGEIKIAITPNEMDMVPKFIKKVINIEDRYIDFNTFVAIINKLELNNENITRNLIKYMDFIVGTDLGENQKYIADHLKSEMLKRVIHNAAEAILLTDYSYLVVYANDRAETLFNLRDGMQNINLSDVFRGQNIDPSAEEKMSNKLLNIGGSNYMVSKNPIMILDQIVGYSIMLSNEQDIKDIGNDLNRELAKNGLVAKYSFENILGSSEQMKRCIEIGKRAALTDFTVLIYGESGTGKELMAQSIHNYSKRSGYAFVAINCAALPESLLESELFGYEKGAFTGALNKGKPGLFEQGDKGTIFLDEIGDMTLNLQARLLRVLQEKQIMRLGSDRVIDIDIRIIAATNKELWKEVQEKKFREDLYYRLCNIPVVLPPLRLRKRDIPQLLNKFLGDEWKKLSEAEKVTLEEYEWPGNVRELENVANYYETMGELPEILGKSRVKTTENTKTWERMILEIVGIYTEERSGIGRVSVLRELEKQGIYISDDKVRRNLKHLADNQLISIGKGRIGNQITEKGMAVLKNVGNIV